MHGRQLPCISIGLQRPQNWHFSPTSQATTVYFHVRRWHLRRRRAESQAGAAQYLSKLYRFKIYRTGGLSNKNRTLGRNKLLKTG